MKQIDKVMLVRLYLGKSLKETAEITGLTKERVRQIEAKILRKFRDRLTKRTKLCGYIEADEVVAEVAAQKERVK